jgi:hypothetical protein
MLEHAMLRDRFEELLDDQRRIEGVYASMADTTDDPSLREQIQQIHRDKCRHVYLTERLIEILG